MITIEGTVSEILGYPLLFLIKEASNPAVRAPINAAAAGGICVKSTSSSRSVLAMAPINAAEKAFLGQKMILRDTWMISGHIWMIRKNQRKVR